MVLGTVFGGIPFSSGGLSTLFSCTGTFSGNILTITATNFSNFFGECSSEFLRDLSCLQPTC